MKEKDLIRFMDRMIEERKAEYALGTAHIYQASRNALSAFLKAHDIPFKRVRPELLKQFERFLRRRGNSWNTVSTYMRVLRLSITGRSTGVWHLTCHICSKLYIPVLRLISNEL